MSARKAVKTPKALPPANSIESFTGKKRVRRSFGRIEEVAQMPNLIEVQRQSYELFLQAGITAEDREVRGLEEVFSSVFPIKDFSDKAEIDFVKYELEQPKYDVEECQQRGMTFAAPLRVTLRLSVFDVDEDSGLRSIRDIKEQDVYMVDMPLMTKNGTFVVNGTERVIVSQMHRSPGVFFDHDGGKGHVSGKYLFSARVIPYRGSWLDFEFDGKDHMYVRIDRRRKLPVTTLLRALDSAETAKYRAECIENDAEIDPVMVQGMSNEEILGTFYDTQVYAKDKKGWKTAFDAERFRGVKLVNDLVDAKTGKVAEEEGTKITARKAKKLVEGGLKDILVAEEQLLGQYLAADIFDNETGQVLFEAGHEITEEDITQLEEMKVKELPLLGIDHVNVGAYVRNTMALDKCDTREEALIDIYRVMRPGEPPTVESAEALFNSLFFDAERYDLSPVGRVKMNARLDLEAEDQFRIPAQASVREFFGSSQLSQFMDQTNPLSEITHKRRLSALGPGGLTRERAGFEVRDVHPTHYGRICPIETPEGPNIGLINSLATFARVNKYGFIEGPYRKVSNGKVTPEVIYMSAMEEAKYTIAQANSELTKAGGFANEKTMMRTVH